MHSIRTWCTPVEIDLCYFPICIITHNNNEFNKTLMYSRSKFSPQKSPIHLKNYLQAKHNSVAKKLFDQESEGKLKK